MLKFEHYWLFHWFEVDEAQLEKDDINRIWQYWINWIKMWWQVCGVASLINEK